jgi:hypothetical protein
MYFFMSRTLILIIGFVPFQVKALTDVIFESIGTPRSTTPPSHWPHALAVAAASDISHTPSQYTCGAGFEIYITILRV